MAHLDRVRALRLMEGAGIDALILFSSEAFRHATGAPPGVATMWRREGAVAVLIPADPDQPETAIVSDLFAQSFRSASHIRDVRESPIWVEALTLPDPVRDASAAAQFASRWDLAGRPPGAARPETFDPSVCYRHLRDALAEKGLRSGRVGVELSAISARGYPALAALLAPATLVDATGVAQSLRAKKSAEEIALLRAAASVAETGIAAVRDALAPGVARSELAAVWTRAVRVRGHGLPMTGEWEYISVGADPWGGDATAQTGDLVKVDFAPARHCPRFIVPRRRRSGGRGSRATAAGISVTVLAPVRAARNGPSFPPTPRPRSKRAWCWRSNVRST